MSTTRNNPKRHKGCVFCHYWTGDANMKFINSTVGFEYELTAIGKCTKCNANKRTHQACPNFVPSVDASKLL